MPHFLTFFKHSMYLASSRSIVVTIHSCVLDAIKIAEYPIALPISNTFFILCSLIYFIINAIDFFSMIGTFFSFAYLSISNICSFNLIHLYFIYFFTNSLKPLISFAK